MTTEELTKAVIRDFSLSVNSVNRYRFIERMLRSYVEYLHEVGAIELSIADGFLKYKKSQPAGQ